MTTHPVYACWMRASLFSCNSFSRRLDGVSLGSAFAPKSCSLPACNDAQLHWLDFRLEWLVIPTSTARQGEILQSALKILTCKPNADRVTISSDALRIMRWYDHCMAKCSMISFNPSTNIPFFFQSAEAVSRCVSFCAKTRLELDQIRSNPLKPSIENIAKNT